MKRLSAATSGDIEILLDRLLRVDGFVTAEEAARSFVGMLYGYFQGSLVLLRLFMTVGYGELPAADREFVDKRAVDSGGSHLIHARTPILTLLATRGLRSNWNERSKSQRFRCIPLVSGEYIASLPMLSMQFKSMNFDLNLIDAWDEAIIAKGRADRYSGMLYIRDAAGGRDEHGRMIVPAQEFVADNNVRTVFGFGSGYAHHPALLTLFAFTNDGLNETMMKPFARLLATYRSLTEELIRSGSIFGLSHDVL
jgi:hypothetical protein